jgi:hypothetical protein
MSIISKFIYRFKAMPIKTPEKNSVDIKKIITFTWKGKGTRIAKPSRKRITL